jgi:small GTP-binding protein
MVPRINIEDINENFDNMTGLDINFEENFCVCCGERINNKLSVCKKCNKTYFKGLDAVYSNEFARTIKKVQPPKIHGKSHGGKYLFKIILAGACEKERTAFLERYTTGQFNSDTKMTIGVDFAVHYQELPDNQGTANLQFWDFGGEKRYRTMVPAFCQGASGALLFFNLTDPQTFYDLKEWIEIIRRNTQNIPIILLGTKYHLIKRPSDINISSQEVMSFIRSNKINGYLNISTKTGLNVSESLIKLTELMIN